MSLLFLLTFKKDVEFVYENSTIRQVMEKFDYHRYTVLPVLKKNEEYFGSISEGDLLRHIKNKHNFNIQDAQNTLITDLVYSRQYQAVSINACLDEIFNISLDQNFIPVVDDRNMFIGIIKRKDLIKYFYQTKNKSI